MRLVCLLLMVSQSLGITENGTFELSQKFGRNNQLSGEARERLEELVKKNQVVVQLTVKQKPWNVGTLFAAVSGKKPLFRLLSKNSESLLILRYQSRDGLRIIKTPFDLADGKDHKIVFSMINGTISLNLDCRELLDLQNTGFRAPRHLKKLQFWIGQKNLHHSYFHGAITGFQIGSEIPQTVGCKFQREERSRRPAADHKADFCPECFNYLKHRIDDLTSNMLELRNKLQNFENRVQVVQLHQRGCNDGSIFYAETQTWVTDDCQSCVCTHGRVRCHPVGCPALNCTRPEKEPGSCCPKCLGPCTFNGKLYQHGEVFLPRKCLECSCEDGQERCRHIHPHNCPKLSCSRKDQVSLPDRCCSMCQNIDFCNLTHPYPCGVNAGCENGKYGPNCFCKPGYFGDPSHECFDVDECNAFAPEIAEQVVGCGHGAVCVNTPGSFDCHCRPGFFKLNEKQCFDVILH